MIPCCKTGMIIPWPTAFGSREALPRKELGQKLCNWAPRKERKSQTWRSLATQGTNWQKPTLVSLADRQSLKQTRTRSMIKAQHTYQRTEWAGRQSISHSSRLRRFRRWRMCEIANKRFLAISTKLVSQEKRKRKGENSATSVPPRISRLGRYYPKKKKKSELSLLLQL